MPFLALALIFLAIFVAVIAKIWLIYQAFFRNVLWGLLVLLVPFASLFFVIVAWTDAKRPFFLFMAACGIFGAGYALLPENLRDPQSLLKWAEVQRAAAHNPLEARTALPNPPVRPEPLAPQVAPEPSIEVQLARLTARETDLRARKAALKPDDRAAADALAREIAQYNVDLKAALERRKAAVEGK